MNNKTILTLSLALITTSPLFAKDKKGMKPSAAELIQAYDKDGDSKLDEAELTAAIDSLKSKRGKGKKEGMKKEEMKKEEMTE